MASNGTTLAYDPMGRLWQVAKGATSTRFPYDGDELAAEYDGTGALTRRYMFGPGTDEPILVDEGGALNCSGTKFLHANHQGSIVALADCWGNRTNVNSYDEYGVPGGVTLNGIPGSTNTGRFQYTGQAWIAELGLYYYKARFYSPTLGRFLQTDPIGYDDQINLYAYVGNDPVNRSDPTGEDSASFYVGNRVPDLELPSVDTLVNIATGIAVFVDFLDGPIPDVGAAALAARAAAKADKVGDVGKALKLPKAAENRAANIKKGVSEKQLGPSGKPKQHTNVHSSRKEAREAAERRTPAGGSVRHDTNPASPKQGPHYQPEKPDGKNVHPNVHEEYPRRK